MDENRESGLLMDQFGSFSPKLSDSFRPQHIQADFTNAPLKEYTESVRSLNFPSSELQQPQKQIPNPRTSIHVKKLNKVSEKHILMKKEKEEPNQGFERQSPILWKMIYKEKLIHKFVENLRKQAHLLPKIFLTKSSNFFRESYLENKHSLFIQKNNQISQNQVLEIIPTLNPTGVFVLAWNFLRALQLMFLMWWLPFKKAFTPNYVFEIDVLEISLIAVFIFDILIKLNSGFIKEGEMIIDRVEIIKHYMSNEVQVDTIYLITQLIVIRKINIEVEIIQVFMVFIQFFLNFTKLQKQVNKYGEMLATQSSYVQIIDLIQLIMLVFYFAHCMACIWYYVGIESLTVYEISWTSTYLIHSDRIALYLYSFYWAITTMVTVGYGDISAQNNYEILCATILMMFSTGMFAFAINQIGEIFNNLDAEKQNYKRALLLINQYMKKNQVDSQIQSRIRNYLKYQENIKMQSKNEELDTLIQKLPSNIQADLQKNIQQKIMQEIEFYKSNFSPNVIPTISQSLQIQCFTPKEIIFQQGQTDDCSLYTVWKGEVLIVECQSGKVLATLSKGESFGEREFLTSESHNYTAISKDLSQILKISRDKFLQIVKYSEFDFEQFHKLKDQMIYSQINGITKCYCCHENHLLNVCPNINYLPNRDRLIMNNFIETKSHRQQYQRSGRKRTFCQYQSLKSETSDNNETYKNGNETYKNVPQLSIRDQEEQPAKSPMRHKARTPTLMNQKIQGQLFHIEEEQNSDSSPQYKSNLEPQNEVYQVPHRVSQGQILEVPNGKNRQSLSNTIIPFSSSFNQLDLIKQEFQKYLVVNIDKMKSFNNYYPQNNLEVVLLRYRKYMKGKKQVNSESLGELTKKRLGLTMKKLDRIK